MQYTVTTDNCLFNNFTGRKKSFWLPKSSKIIIS